ncbi:NACHT domain-containing protein [Oscillatoria sp. FACHB-1407]|uniref:NACHT domain-containing protein n=1 Tax=Oscillatoria sp. FACHB-1407 TaxID=2692847 RepID=UPI00168743E7|nr:NACHT domain-containing protein [Oscillatoria sp. FACHB-1407]MBD2465030.1 NACHT domain-containing protein [Oscillatoria sp. FACHB-1407]
MTQQSAGSGISFNEADQSFDLIKLQADLESIKCGKVTATDWKYFKGILCGNGVSDISKLCCVQQGTVFNALNKRIKPYLYRLLNRPEPEEERVDWSRVPKWLIEAGYGIGENHRVNWQQICRTMLDRQKKLSTNEVIASEAMQFDLLSDEIFVSLALVERKEPDQLKQDVHPARPVERFEERPPIEYEKFQKQVLRPRKSDRIAIIGEPGAGKTTLLQHIAFWILEQKLGLPIWISLGDLVKNGDLQRLKDYLIQVWLDDAVLNITEDVKSDFLAQLNQQQVWLLLDGVDEIVASSSVALREINSQLRAWSNQSFIILTCRTNVWDADINALRDFQTYRTKELHYPTQVEQFIENGFRKSNPQSSQRLKSELAKPEQTRLQQLVQNPLRLMMLCTTWYDYASLPATKAELYERFVREFYKWNKTKWKRKDLNYEHFPNTEAKQNKLNQALGRLSCRALDKESSPFRLPHNLVVDELGDPDGEGSNFWLALNLGWLQIARDADKPSEKVYIFFHPTFQEYFAALAIDDWDDFLPCNHINQPTRNRKDEYEYRVFSSQWREAIFLWIGLNSKKEDRSKEEFIQKLIHFNDGCRVEKSEKGFYEFQLYFLAAILTLDFYSFPNAQLDEIVDQIIKWGFGYFSNQRQQWFRSLDSVEDEAQRVLSRINHPKVLEALLKLIDGCPDRYIVYSAANVLWKIDPTHPKSKAIPQSVNNETSVIEQIGLLDIEHDPEIPRTVEALIDLITPRQERRARRTFSPSTLAAIFRNNQAAINSLKELIQPSHDQSTRWQIAEILIEIEPDNQSVIQYLIEVMLDSEDEMLFTRIAEILLKAHPNHKVTIQALIDLVCFGRDDYERERTVLILKRVLHIRLLPSVVRQLKEYINDDNLNRGAACFEILWHCAQNMSYPDFYRAWHSSSADIELSTDDLEVKP